jgi:hypothetical protein
MSKDLFLLTPEKVAAALEAEMITPPDVACADTVDESITNEPPAVVVVVCVVDDCGLNVELVLTAVCSGLMVPVQTAPSGQQATFPPWSGEQTLLGWQHRPGEPSPSQLEYWSGQLVLLLCRRCNGDGI